MRRTAATVLALALLSTACQVAAGQDETALRLDEVSLTADRAEELDRVRFTGVDEQADLSELELVLRADQAGEFGLMLHRDAAGLYTTVPLHPDTPGQGGRVELQLTSGGDTGPVLSLELTGLPRADGAWDALLDAFTSALDARARAAGSTLEAVRATPFEDLDATLAVVRLVAGYVDDGTEHDLESLLESDEVPLSAAERAVVDAVIAKLDPLQMVRPSEDLPEFAASTTPSAVAAPDVVAAAVPGVVDPAPAPSSSGSSVLLAAPAATCRTSDLAIDSAPELAAAMAVGVGAQIHEGGAVSKLMEDAEALGSLTEGVPLAGDLMTIVGAIYGTAALWRHADAGRHPTELTAMAAAVDPRDFNEDFTRPGRVGQVTVMATSTGYDASAELSQLATNVIHQALNLSVAGKLATTGAVVGAAESYLAAQEDRLRKLVTNEVIKASTKDRLTWCPETWEVDITGARWVDLLGLARLDTNRAQQSYQPNSVGSGLLRVQADPEAFSGMTVRRDVPISIERLTVLANPTAIEVDEPGAIVTINAEVINADTTTLRWDPGPGRWADGTGVDTNDGGSRPLVTPTDPNAYPFEVVITSTSKTGLRENATDDRDATVLIELAAPEVVVTPDPGRVQVGGRITFVATSDDGTPVDVRWDATGGDIEGGVYVAGDREGTFTVTATSVDDPTVSASAAVVIGELAPCDLTDGETIGRFLGGSFGAGRPNPVFPDSSCEWPGADPSGVFHVTTWSPAQASTVQARYDDNPSWHLDGVADAAFFDPDQVGQQIGARSTDDDGTVHSSAFANLDVRSGEQWFMVQVTGLRAEGAGIEHALASVAQQIHDNLRGGGPR